MNNYEFCAQWILDRKHGKNVRDLYRGCGSGKIVKALQSLPGLSSPTPFLAAFMLCAGLALTTARVEAAYTVVELDANLPEDPSRVVVGLNENGEVVGGGLVSRRPRGLLFSGGNRSAPQNVDGRPNSDHNVANGINLAGQIVGAANTRTGVLAFRSLRGSGSLDLAPLRGDSSSVAFAINDPGQSVGYSGGPDGIRAVLWSQTGIPAELPGLPGSHSSKALAINNPGVAVGISGTRAVLWSGGSVKDLGALPGEQMSEAKGINNTGDVVGSSGDPDMQQQHAVLWKGGANIQDLGTLGGPSSRALGVNNLRQVVGTSATKDGVHHAFLWTESQGMQNLNDLLSSPQSFVLTQAVAITNGRGLILAHGWRKDIPDAAEDEIIPHFYLLTPTP